MGRPLSDEEKELARQRRGWFWWTGMALFVAVMGLVVWGIADFVFAAFG